MPVYTYECFHCECREDQARRVDRRDERTACDRCGRVKSMRRVFTPTANVFVPTHFRHLQSQFLPPKGDPSWEYLGRNDQMHEPREEGPTLKEHLQREFLHSG